MTIDWKLSIKKYFWLWFDLLFKKLGLLYGRIRIIDKKKEENIKNKLLNSIKIIFYWSNKKWMKKSNLEYV